MTQQLTKDSFKSNGKSILAVDFFNFRILFMNIWSLSHLLSDCSFRENRTQKKERIFASPSPSICSLLRTSMSCTHLPRVSRDQPTRTSQINIVEMHRVRIVLREC